MKPKYYQVDVGYLPTHILLCFDRPSFMKALKDNNVPVAAEPLDGSVAETHTFNFNNTMLIIVIVDVTQKEEDAASLAGTVAHECCHVVDSIMDHIGEDVADLGPESRAYLMQHLVEQIFFHCVVEAAYAERKRTRAEARKKAKSDGRTVPEVDKSGDNGGAGSLSDLPVKDNPSGDEGPKGQAVPAPRVYDSTTIGARDKGTRHRVGRPNRRIPGASK